MRESAVRAPAFRDHERLFELHGRFSEWDHRGAVEYLHAVVSVGLRRRFGDRPGPLAHAELGRFMAELRHAGPGFAPPRNLLEVEAVIRGLRGEEHLLDEIGPKQLREALAFALRYLTDTEAEIHDDFDTVVDEAQRLMRQALTGSPEP
ncbi:hypothetical protein [Glycomyces tenuis]|uniref:hypothetical protein n=1 Tax=Glycomyces tenuis TaxID=58116 RepID=UPI0012DF9845|nr:hypothetical protein [Glycomyces tenuis]